MYNVSLMEYILIFLSTIAIYIVLHLYRRLKLEILSFIDILNLIVLLVNL